MDRLPGRPPPRRHLDHWEDRPARPQPARPGRHRRHLEARDVGVKSLTIGIVDTTTAQGKRMFGMFALMAEYEAALIKERTLAGLAAARTRGRKPKMTSALIDKAQRMYESRQFTMAEIAASCAVTPMTVYGNIRTAPAAPSEEVTAAP